MNLSKWEVFSKVAEHGSLTKAAMMLDTAQSVVSRQINALERECGGRLFLRTGRGVLLTETGERVLPRVRALLAEAAQIANDVKGAAGVPVGVVRLGVIPSISYPLVNTLLRQVRALYPLVQLQLFEGSSGQLDEMQSRAGGKQSRDGRLADAGRSPEDQRRQRTARQHPSERPLRPEQMILPDHLGKRLRAQLIGQRPRRIALEAGSGEECRRFGPWTARH